MRPAMANPRLTRYVPIAPAPSPRSRSALPAQSNLDAQSPTAISRFDNNTTSETRHHVEPDLSALYASASIPSTNYQVPLFNHVPQSPYDGPADPRFSPAHHALANQHPRLRTNPSTVNYGPHLSIPSTLPPAPSTTSRHTPRSPDKHTFAVPRVPVHSHSAPSAPSSSGFAPDFLQNYLSMINTPNQPDAAASVNTTMNEQYDEHFLTKLIQGGKLQILSRSPLDLIAMDTVASPATDLNQMNPTPYSTPLMGDYDTMRSINELLTSPEFTSPLFEDTPNLSDASPFTPSSTSTRHQTSPALFDYDGTNSGSVPLFGPGPAVVSTPNLDFDTLQLQSGGMGFETLDALLQMPGGSPTSPAMDTQALFSPQASPLFSAEHSASAQNSPTQRPPAGSAGQRSVSDPAGTKRSQPTGHRKNLSPEQLLPVDAPTQQRNYYGPSATARKELPAGFESRAAKIIAKRKRGVEAAQELTEADILNQAVDEKRRANTVAARRSRQRKLEHVKRLEDELEEVRKEAELWKERAIAAENMLKQYKSA